MDLCKQHSSTRMPNLTVPVDSYLPGPHPASRFVATYIPWSWFGYANTAFSGIYKQIVFLDQFTKQ